MSITHDDFVYAVNKLYTARGDDDNNSVLDDFLALAHAALHDGTARGGAHHHHGHGDDDLIVHKHDNDEPWHDHIIADGDDDAYYFIDVAKQFYGSRDHTHD